MNLPASGPAPQLQAQSRSPAEQAPRRRSAIQPRPRPSCTFPSLARRCAGVRAGRRRHEVSVFDCSSGRRCCWRLAPRASRPRRPRTTGRSSAGSGPAWQRIAQALPATWSQTENVVWKVAIPGHGWSSPIVWDDLVVVTSAVSDDPGPGPQLGLYDGHSSAAIPTADPPLDGLRPRPCERPGALGARGARIAAAHRPARQEHLRVGDAGHRRRARLRLLRRHRAVRLRHGRQPGLVEGDGAAGVPPRLGRRRVARAARRPALHRERQRQPVVPGGLRQAHRRGGAARGPRRGQQLGHAVHLGEQRPHRDRHRRQRQGALLRPRRRAAVGAHRHDVDHVADALRQARAAVRQLRLPGGRRAPGVRHPARAPSATSRWARAATATSTSPGRTRSWAPTARRRWCTATSSTRCSTAAS